MKRRNFLEAVQWSGLSLVLGTSFRSDLSSVWQKEGYHKIILQKSDHRSIELPAENRIPFGWPAIGINPGDSIIFKPEKRLETQSYLWLRVSIAQEIRDVKKFHVSLVEDQTELGFIDIRYSSVLVPYQLQIDPKFIDSINKHGLRLTLEASEPLWIFDTKARGINNRSFLPHLLTASSQHGSIENFLNCFTSTDSIQSFGWREGTVLDGLWQLYSRKGNQQALQAINKHFDLYFDRKQNLIYETSHSIPNDNQINGIESTIPFATLVRLYPDHPILKTVVAAWEDYTKDNGMITDGRMRSAEGCYTVAYPMALIGKAWQREDLKMKALEQLIHRFVLIHDQSIYLRYTEGDRTYRNWARGAAWFLIGFARTMTELKDELGEDIITKFREGIDIALSMQRKDGLWSCFMHEDVLPDTSGSSGIAAAILTGINEGFLPESYRKPAIKCWEALPAYLTPDGFLQGVAQDNRGGIALQQSDYRVIAQMGMGLMAQLYAAI